MRRDRLFPVNKVMKEKKEKPINYDFHDPVLNKEFVESITKKN